MTEEQQTVTDDTNGQDQPAAEGAGERDKAPSLDELLAQYEEAKDGKDKPDDPGKKADGDDRVARLESELEEIRKRDQEREYSGDVQKAVKTIRGDFDAGTFTDRRMEGWLTAEAQDDPRIARAWTDRSNNPTAWAQIEGQLAQRFADFVKSIPDKIATEDRAAIADAMRGASKKASDDGDFDRQEVLSMSDSEFEGFIRQVDRQNAA